MSSVLEVEVEQRITRAQTFTDTEDAKQLHGSNEVHENIYGAWWFTALWAMLSVASSAILIRRRIHRKAAVALLHLSFLVILIGAFVTHLTSVEGSVHLRKGDETRSFTDSGKELRQFPFSLSLKDFEITYYPGTDAVMDYKALISVKEGTKAGETIQVSINNIGKMAGYRLYQSSYDTDREGVVLLVACDPYGIAVTYTGYLMLLLSLIWTLMSRHTRIRQLYRMAAKSAAALLLLLFFLPSQADAQVGTRRISKETAREMGTITVLYGGRICPLNTVATEFVTKLCGKGSWKGMSADEIFLGWMIYYSEWETQPIIKVKNREVQRMLGIDGKWACLQDFYTSWNKYKLGDRLNDRSLSESTRKALRETDEKIQMITMFYNSEMLRIFPLRSGARLAWNAPSSTELPQDVGEAEFQFINHAMDNLVKQILVDDNAGARFMIAKIKLYQKEKAGEAMPSRSAIRAEVLYNRLQSAGMTVYILLALSFLSALSSLVMKRKRWHGVLLMVFITVMAAYLSLLLVLRWWVSGHVPLGNGYETMLFLAWTMTILTLALMRRISLLKAFGHVASALCQLVAAFATGNPQVTPLMPVLQSPLLAVHVAVIMISYALLAFIAFMAAYCLTAGRNSDSLPQLTAMSRLLLYPAVACLCIGIFIGAVWANISWGNYWSWDPKETWALITMMIYAVPLHDTALLGLHDHRRYHIYVLAAFLTVIMTYFGVNYFMVGMHSYAFVRV